MLQQIWLYGIIGITLPMCPNSTMRVNGAWIKRYCVLCSKTQCTLHSYHNFPAGSRQAARGNRFCETSLLCHSMWKERLVLSATIIQLNRTWKEIPWVPICITMILFFKSRFLGSLESYLVKQFMMILNGNVFRITGPLWEESTGHRWIPLTKASDAKLWCFLWYGPHQTVE